MKLLLTSQGTINPKVLDELIRLNGKDPKDTSLLFITTAAKVTENKYMPGEIERLKSAGFNLTEFDLAESSANETEKAVKDHDIIYVIGGQPFYLLKESNRTEFGKWLKLHGDNKLYVGASAGSYLACPTLEMGLWKKPDRDTYGLENLNGLGLVDFLIFAHHEEKYKDLLREKSNQLSTKIYSLTDAQAISFEGSKLNIIN